MASKAAPEEKRPMPAGLPVALALLAQAAAAPGYGPPDPPQKQAATPAKPGERDCAPQPNPASANEIVVCAVKPQGYRLPPDIVEARRLKKKGEAGRPRNPHETYADHSCARVGPMGCRGGPTIDLIAVAATAAQMASRLSNGQEVGSMFVTDPHPNDYQLYQEAKKEREAKEAEKAAEAAKAKAQAAQSAAPATPAAQPTR